MIVPSLGWFVVLTCWGPKKFPKMGSYHYALTPLWGWNHVVKHCKDSPLLPGAQYEGLFPTSMPLPTFNPDWAVNLFYKIIWHSFWNQAQCCVSGAQALNKYWWITLSLTFGRKRPKKAVISSNDCFPKAFKITGSVGAPAKIFRLFCEILGFCWKHSKFSKTTHVLPFKYILFLKCTKSWRKHLSDNVLYPEGQMKTTDG
jgi:hypothetical protein